MSNETQTKQLASLPDEAKHLVQDLVLFRPCAYFDKHMDCIRVELRDCSVKEVRISEYLTLHLDNRPDEGQSHYVGITIKGIKHLFTEHNLPLDGIVRITQLLDLAAKTFDESASSTFEIVESAANVNATEAIERIGTFARESELRVDMRANSKELALAA